MLELSNIDETIAEVEGKLSQVLAQIDSTATKREKLFKRQTKLSELLKHLKIVKDYAAKYEAGAVEE